jgi:tripartite-type tricarboxylate transporter receptor subunit TctC
LEVLPNIQTVGEFVPGYEMVFFYSIGSSRNTPIDIINKLNKEINAALADPKINARLAYMGATVFPSSPADLGKLIAEESEKWAEVIKAANIKVE